MKTKIKNKFQNYENNYIIPILLLISLVLISVLYYLESYIRLYQSFIDLYHSSIFYFSQIFDFKHEPTILKPIEGISFIPSRADLLKAKFINFFKLLIDKGNISRFLLSGLMIFIILIKAAMIIAPLAIMLYVYSKVYKRKNNKYDKVSKPLKAYYKFSKKFENTRNVFKKYKEILKDSRAFKSIIIALFLLNFNFVTIGIETLAYFTYLIASFNVFSFYIYLYKVTQDLSIWLFQPILIRLAVYIFLFTKLKYFIGKKRLKNLEIKDEEWLEDKPLSLLFYGSMAKGKTTLLTDLAITQDLIYRKKSYETMQKYLSYFPNFNILKMERYFNILVASGVVSGLSDIEDWVAELEENFKNSTDSKFFDYDTKKYKIAHNNRLVDITIFDFLKEYLKAYYIFTYPNSLIISNYAIRSDNFIDSRGNASYLSYDFFDYKNEPDSNYSRIIDFDFMRLGKRFSNSINIFEFGVIAITEIAKERGNQFDHRGLKKGDEHCNKINDLFNSYVKLLRHPATIDFQSYIRLFCDEQRVDSLNVDLRELSALVNILEVSEERLTLPFYKASFKFYDYLIQKLDQNIEDYKIRRADESIYFKILNNLNAKLKNHKEKIKNTFGYKVCKLEMQKSMQGAKIDTENYYLINQKVYKDRFSTDAFSEFFKNRMKNQKNTFKTYKTSKASIEELQEQNSFFISELERLSDWENFENNEGDE